MLTRIWTGLLVGLLTATLLPAVALAQEGPDGERLAGRDRYGTAAAIAHAAFPQGSATAYLARGDLPVDALAAGVLRDGPVLLVPPCGSIPAAVTDAIAALGVEQVVAIGGPNAVCEAHLDDFGRQGLSTDRVAGTNRYQTAVAISRRTFPDGAYVAYLASGNADAPDAVAGGALTDGPILTVPPDGPVPPPVAAEISRLDAQRVVGLGGPRALAEDVLQAAAAGRETSRHSGPSRFDTALAIAEAAFPIGAPTVYVARADLFVDAIAGGVLRDGPVVLVPRCGEVPEAVRSYLEAARALRIVALGGPAAVCPELLHDISRYELDLTPRPEDAPDNDPSGRQDVVVSPLARFPDETAVTGADDDHIVFDREGAPEARALQPGHVMTVLPSPELPEGALRRVTSVAIDDDSVTVETDQASLPDVIIAGTVDLEMPLHGDFQPGEEMELATGQVLRGVGETEYPGTDEGADLRQSAHADPRGYEAFFFHPRVDRTVAGSLELDFARSAGASVQLGDASISGELDVSATLSINLVVQVDLVSLAVGLSNPLLYPTVRGEARSIDAEVGLAQELGLTATWQEGISQEIERPLGGPINLGTQVVFVGPIPVPFTTQLSFVAAASWEAQATATVGITQDFSQTVGVHYEHGQGWDDPYSERVGPTFTGPTGSVETTLDAEASITATLRSSAWDAIGPTAALKAFVEGDYTWNTDPALRSGSVAIGLEPRIGMAAQVPLFGHDVGSVSLAPVGRFRTTIWELDDDGETDPGTGDVQVTLTWGTTQDLDLHVIDPFGDRIFYGQPSSPSGGFLDRDANPNCGSDTSPVENVFWPDYSAPTGDYVVEVDEFNLCGAPSPSYRLTVRLDGEIILDETRTGEGSWTFTVP